MATQEQGAEMLSRKDMTEILPGSAGFEMQGGNLLSSGDPQQSDVSSAGQSAASTGITTRYWITMRGSILTGYSGRRSDDMSKVSQLVGSNTLEEFEGYLIGVGINYIILQDYITGNIRILDIYGIKNMYVYYANIRSQLSED